MNHTKARIVLGILYNKYADEWTQEERNAVLEALGALVDDDE